MTLLKDQPPEERLLRKIMKLKASDPLPEINQAEVGAYIDLGVFVRLKNEIGIGRIGWHHHWNELKRTNGLFEAATPEAMWMETFVERKDFWRDIVKTFAGER